MTWASQVGRRFASPLLLSNVCAEMLVLYEEILSLIFYQGLYVLLKVL